MRSALPLLPLVLILGLTGCAGQEDTGASPSPSGGSGAVAPSESASPSASPTPSIEIKPATCEKMLDRATLDRIAAEKDTTGLGIIPGWAEKMQTEGQVLGLFADYGGVSCAVGYPGGDNISPYAWSPIDEESAVAVQVQLTSEEFASRPDPSGDLWCLPTELATNGAEPCYLFRGSDWFYTDTPSLMQGYVDRIDAL